MFVLSPVSFVPGQIPPPSSSACDWSDRRQRQWQKLHRQTAGGSWRGRDRLRQTGSQGVPARHAGLSQGASGVWVR